MNDKKDFEAALKGKKVPLLVLDQKWHRLFAIHGKTDEISATEKELDELFDELEKAAQVFVVCVKLASVEKLLAE